MVHFLLLNILYVFSFLLWIKDEFDEDEKDEFQISKLCFYFTLHHSFFFLFKLGLYNNSRYFSYFIEMYTR